MKYVETWAKRVKQKMYRVQTTQMPKFSHSSETIVRK